MNCLAIFLRQAPAPGPALEGGETCQRINFSPPLREGQGWVPDARTDLTFPKSKDILRSWT